jgi:hypothetical protein
LTACLAGLIAQAMAESLPASISDTPWPALRQNKRSPFTR